MKVKDAHAFLQGLMDEGKDDLPMYTEYERVYQMDLKVADSCCDGSSMALTHGEEFVSVDLDH